MDIMELGAIGELVGGVAVIGSLLYVGLQVRQSNLQSAQRTEIERNESERQFARDSTAVAFALTDPDLSNVFRRGLDDLRALDGDEQLRFDMWLTGLGNHCTLMWRRGLVREPLVWKWMEWFVSLTKTPGGAMWWESVRFRYVDEFAEEVDALSAEIPAATEVEWFDASSQRAKA